MIKKIFHIILWIVGIAGLACTVNFSLKKSQKVTCGHMVIAINDSVENRFVSKREISRWMKRNYGDIFGQPLDSINLMGIEEGLDNFQSIEKATVYTAYKNADDDGGTLVLRVEQRKPVFRVLSRKCDYYVDRFGAIIDWNPNYTAHTILAGGNISRDFATEVLLPVLRFVDEDKFWRAQLDQVYVDASGELTFIPRVGDHQILFGECQNYREKFRNLRALYVDGFRKGGWGRYKTIDLKYKNQIVCTKK